MTEQELLEEWLDSVRWDTPLPSMPTLDLEDDGEEEESAPPANIIDLRVGDKPGHKFHGNQWSGMQGITPKSTREEIVSTLAKHGYTGPTSYTKGRLLMIARKHFGKYDEPTAAAPAPAPVKPATKLSRKEMLEDLKKAGYTGPTSYTKERLAEIHAKHTGGDKPTPAEPASAPTKPVKVKSPTDPVIERMGVLPYDPQPSMRTQTNMRRYFEHEYDNGADGPEVQAISRGIQELDDEIVAHGVVAIDMPASSVVAMVRDGRMKTQHETGDSMGMLDPAFRRDAEKNMFGAGATSGRPETNPVYGHILDGTPDDEQVFTGYGDFKLVLHPHVKERTTFTVGDSLDPPNVAPVRIGHSRENEPWHNASAITAAGTSYESFRSLMSQHPEEHQTRIGQIAGQAGYIEAQVHGGVRVPKDVHHVVYDRRNLARESRLQPGESIPDWVSRARVSLGSDADAILALHSVGIEVRM